MDTYTKMYRILTRVSSLINKKENLERKKLGPHADDSRGQGKILATLSEYGELRVKDLERILGIRPQSLHEQLKQLERHGYIVREPSKRDRRVRIVKLTEKGIRQKDIKMDNSYLFTGFTPEELEDLRDYLIRLEENLEDKIIEPDHRAERPKRGEIPPHLRKARGSRVPHPPRHGEAVPPHLRPEGSGELPPHLRNEGKEKIDREVGAALRESDPTLFNALSELLGIAEKPAPDDLEARIRRQEEEICADFGPDAFKDFLKDDKE